MKEIQGTIYEAIDGRKFLHKQECINWDEFITEERNRKENLKQQTKLALDILISKPNTIELNANMKTLCTTINQLGAELYKLNNNQPNSILLNTDNIFHLRLGFTNVNIHENQAGPYKMLPVRDVVKKGDIYVIDTQYPNTIGHIKFTRK